jgi:hypothetical protein
MTPNFVHNIRMNCAGWPPARVEREYQALLVLISDFEQQIAYCREGCALLEQLVLERRDR